MNLQWKNSAFWQKVQNTMCHAPAAEPKGVIKAGLVAQARQESAIVGPRMAGVFLYSKYSTPTSASLIVPIA